ncbi:MAG: hypothetical protein ACYCW6_24880 [Candidatus Xenobia bacterium]
MKRLLMGLLLLTAASHADPLEIRSTPVAASEVWVRPSGPHPWQRLGNRTPCTLQVPPGTYDLRLIAPDGMFHLFHGERMSVSSGFDRPVVEMHEELAWPRIVGVLVA